MDFQSRNLTVPRGKVYFAKFIGKTMVPGPYRELGNCPEFTLTRESETFPHFSSQHNLRTKDEELTIEATLSGTVVTDDIKRENVEYWFMGETTTQTTTAQTGEVLLAVKVAVNDMFQLGRSETNLGGHRNVLNVIVTSTTTPATTYREGYDYVVDLELGTVTIVEDSTAADKDITITFDTEAATREVTLAKDNQIEGELKFISFNPIGPQRDIIIPRARLAPNGDFALVNDPESPAWQTLPLTISALQKNNLPLALTEGRGIA